MSNEYGKLPCEKEIVTVDKYMCPGKEMIGCKYCPYEKLRANSK